MFEIYKDNGVIATTDSVVYIKKHPTNNSFIPSDENNADGVAIQSLSQTFALMGKELDGLEHVVVVRRDGGTLFKNTNDEVEHIAEILSVDTLRGKSEKEKAIVQTHRWLRAQLRKGMTWKDGNLYNITERKQGFLSTQLQIGSLQVMNGVDPTEVVLRWNASGRAHTDWAFSELTELANDIHNHIEPMVVKQQEAEEQIANAETDEEILEILEAFVV